MRLMIFAAACLLAGCLDGAEHLSTEPIEIISKHTQAFNAGDIQAMSERHHPNIEWFSVKGANISVQVAGRDALAKNMTEYFKSPTKVTSTLRSWSINAPYVSATEIASWTTADGTKKSQSSLTVYELEDKLTLRRF